MEEELDLSNFISRGTEIYVNSKEKKSEAKKLIKEIAKEVNCTPRQVSKCYSMMYNKGNGWVEGNPLELDKEFCKSERIKPDTISKAFMKIVEIFDTFAACGMESELSPYVEALNNALGLQLDWNISKTNESGKTVKEKMNLISDIYKQIDDMGESMDVLGTEAEENNAATKTLFPKLVDWKYKLDNSNEKTVQKVENQIGNYRLNLNMNMNGLSIFDK